MKYKQTGLDSTSLSLFISLSFGYYQPAANYHNPDKQPSLLAEQGSGEQT